MAATASFHEFILNALRKRTRPSDFSEVATQFYDQWFRQRGTSYYVLFKKNTRITNLQFAELVSLLRCHIHSHEDPSFGDPLFVSADEFKGFLASLLFDTLPIKKDYTTGDILAVTQQFETIINRVVVLNPYYGSCTVYLPPTLTLADDKLCAEAGYIHSMGHLVYVRNMTKATLPELTRAIEDHLRKYPLKNKLPALFRPYSHEDFTKWDRAAAIETLKEDDWPKVTHADDLTHGLDDVKIQTRKAYFKTINIIGVLRTLKAQFSSLLEIPAPGSFKKSLDEFRNKHGRMPERTLFLLNDAGLLPNNVHPSSKRYYVCYDQIWFNNDPFYTFDEDKPAWVSHTTIPHSLAAAMINITRPWQKGSIRLIDPFGGSGTTLIEALKRPEIVAVSGDIEELANLVAKDNLSFFRMPLADVTRLRDSLKQYLKQDTLMAALGVPSVSQSGEHFNFATAKAEMDHAVQEAKTDSDLGLSRANAVAAMSYEQRLLFYVLLRTRLRHAVEIQERRAEWPVVFIQELLNLVRRLNSHVNFLELADKQSQTKNGVPHAVGDYSRVCWLNLDNRQKSDDCIRRHDATQIEKDSYDLIITDPPYGFNTQEEDVKLIKLYREFIWSAVAALRDGGQLIVCCPHYSYSGRHVPIFIQPEFVTQQVLLAARDNNKTLRTEQHSLPCELHGLKPPYYWEAPTALQRSILHFRFESRRHSSSKSRLKSNRPKLQRAKPVRPKALGRKRS
ncbi:MAG: hypothetical protein KJZ73_02545 [Pseudorhodoplanes sp.]|nr:hypothetical protein [Pseudorhodoplanes sp.]